MSVQYNFQERRITNPAVRDIRRQLCHQPATMAGGHGPLDFHTNFKNRPSSLQYQHNAASVPASATSCSISRYYSPLPFWEDNAKILEQDFTTAHFPSSPSLAPQVLLSSFVLEEWDEESLAADDEHHGDEGSEMSLLFISRRDFRPPCDIGNIFTIDDRPLSPSPVPVSFIEQQHHAQDVDSDCHATISKDWFGEDREDSVFYSNIFTDNVQNINNNNNNNNNKAVQQEVQVADDAAEDSSSFDAFPFFSGGIFEDQISNQHDQYYEPRSSSDEFVSSDECQEKNSIPVNENHQQENSTIRTTSSAAAKSSQPLSLIFNTIAPARTIPPNRVIDLQPMCSNDNNPVATAHSSRIQMRHLLQPAYRPLTTAFTIEVMNQLEITYFGEKDKRSRRKGLPSHFPGFACGHCKPITGKVGRYFPSTLKTFSDQKKTLFAIHSHLQKCIHCPNDLKAKLEHLKTSHGDEKGKLQHLPGDKRQFYRRVWANIRAMDEKL